MTKLLRLTAQSTSLALALALTAGATASLAAVPTSAPAWTSTGYNGAANTVQSSDPNTTARDSTNNRLIVNGEVQPTSSVSTATQYMSATTGGVGSGGVGAGYATATAIGNLLNVEVSGSNNVVVVNSNQTNTGTVSASAAIGSAKVTANGPQ